MNFKKGLFCASFGLLSIVAFSLSFFNARTYNVLCAEEGIAQKNAPNTDFDGEVDVDSDKLTVTITSSTKTTTCQSMVLNFSTGGTGFQSTKLTYTIAPDDEEFASYYAEFDSMSSEQKKEEKRKIEDGEAETRVFNGQVYSLINRGSSYKDIVIPKKLYRDVYFYFDVTSIHSHCILAEELAPASGSAVQSITIPNTIQTIHANSFPEVLPDGFVFNVEFAQNEVPITWETGWNHGATVNYGCTFPYASEEEPITSIVSYGDKNANFVIGYYPPNDTQYPLVMSYRLMNENTIRYYTFSKSTTSSLGSYYDAVGYQLYETSNSLYADIELDLSSGSEIDPNSVVIHNIFASNRVDGAWTPDFDHPFKATPSIGYAKALDINDLLTFEFTGLSTFAGYTSVNLIFNTAGEEAYAHLKPSYYSQYKERISSGVVAVRYRFASLPNCSFEIEYYDRSSNSVVSKIVPIVTPVANYTLERENGNIVSFLLKNSDIGSNFNSKTIRKLGFAGFYVNVELYLQGKGVVSRSGVVSRFSNFVLMSSSEPVNTFDINLFIIILSASYIVAFAIGTTILFFYYKEKYKNDEFRRLKPKSFIFKAVLALSGSLIVILAITFIILRFVAMNNAIVVYNPVDAFIIIFSILAVIVIGYFIKFLVTTSKANKSRKMAIKLKLNEDTVEDGTN